MSKYPNHIDRNVRQAKIMPNQNPPFSVKKTDVIIQAIHPKKRETAAVTGMATKNPIISMSLMPRHPRKDLC